MRWARQVRVLLLSWFRPSRLDSELDEELQFHIQAEIERNERAGMRREDALRAARLAVGRPDQIRDECRENRPGAFLRQLLRDVRYGGRLLRKTPGFSAAAIVIVAVGIGAVTAMFSVVDGVVLQPLPYSQPNRLVSLWSRMPRLDLPRAFVNAADYQVWRRDNHVFADVALVRPIANFNLTGGGEPERLFGARVSPNLLSVLGTAPITGRGFRSDEDTAGRDRVVLLSHDLWTRRFGADDGIVGQAIRLSGVPHTVVGVMGPRFRYPTREFQLWTPLTINPAELSREDPSHNYLAVGRLKRGVTLQQAQSEMSTICERLARQFADNRDVGVHVVPMLDDAVATVRPALYVLLGAVTCLLLIACLNLSNLLGARAAARHREFALRLSLGASRGRLVLQAIAEVVPLLAIGGLIGMVLVVRARDDAARLSRPVIDAIHGIDPDQPVYDVRTMEQVMERSLGQRWLSAALVGSFATISLVLAAVGLYGVVAFGVTRWLREFGIRLALGATGRDVTRQVIGQAALPSSAGVAVGVAGALFAATLVEGLVYGVNPRDAGTVAACCGVLLAVTLVAAYVPARRAARVDPAMTLRAE